MSDDTCGCCEGTEKLTPMATANRPGLDALPYRVGTHAAFLATMKARLSTMALEVPSAQAGSGNATSMQTDIIYPLRGLTTREGNDPAIALLDSWATVADVLTFYQERIANEGYLRTATERRSVLELARLVGYVPRPGVAASVFLAYTIEPTHAEPVEIALGARAQSIPGPGELPQSFETSEKIEARAAWNTLKPRLTRPQTAGTIQNLDDAAQGPRVYLKGMATNLKPNDPVLVDFGGTLPEFYRVQEVLPDAASNRTLIRLRQDPTAARQQAAADLAPERLEGEVRRTYVETVAAIVDRYLDLVSFDVDPARDMAQRVVNLLQELKEALQADPSPRDLTTLLRAKTLPNLREDQELARQGGYRLLEPWVTGLVEELEETLATATDGLAAAAALEFAPSPAQALDFAIPVPIFPSIGRLTLAPSMPPPNKQQLRRNLDTTFQGAADTGLQILAAFQPELRRELASAVTNTKVTRDSAIKVYALRVTASVFGHNALLEPRCEPDVVTQGDASSPNPRAGNLTKPATWLEWRPADDDDGKNLFLDTEYSRISPGSFAAIQTGGGPPTVFTVFSVQTLSRFAYGIAGKSTKLVTQEAWWYPKGKPQANPPVSALTNIDPIRKTLVYAQSEELPLAEEPITGDVCDGDHIKIELDDFYADLESGRWLIVAGERTDITAPDPDKPGEFTVVRGIKAAELVMISEVVQTVQKTTPASGAYGYADYGPAEIPLPGDRTHTFLRLASALKYCYRRDAVTIYGNVVKATHGETRTEVLGSGDGSKAFQSFTLRQPPLTYLAAVIPAGAASTLKLAVNDIEWHEADALAGLQPIDRRYIIRIDDDGKTTATFGNGKEGARIPTGTENVKAVYRNGIGQPGNVQAGQISLLATRPLGVKGVINPLRASGGADRESRDQVRRNAPLAVMALDRLVSVQDYADFTRIFAGIQKASAKRLTDCRRELIHLTIAGADDIPIDRNSDLYRNLNAALRRFGDPDQPLQIDTRELTLLVISAKVRILPDYQWEPVVTQLCIELLDTFSFARRDLGQDVLLSQVITTMQKVEGVAFVDVDTLTGITEKVQDSVTKTWRPRTPDEVGESIQKALESVDPEERLVVDEAWIDKDGVIRPAQLAFLTPNVPDTLILNQMG